MNPFTTALIKAPKRARFDFNHSNTIGMRIGALTPTESRFIIPGDEVAVSMEQICRLAPMPVPTFVNLKVRHDWFFVPLRLLYGNDYMDRLFGADAGGKDRASSSDLANFYALFSGLKALDPEEIQINDYSGLLPHESVPMPLPGSLFDFLGYPVLSDRNGGLDATTLTAIASQDWVRFASNLNINAQDSLHFSPPVLVEKLFAYHFIWRDWYRFTGIQSNSIEEDFVLNGALANLGMELNASNYDFDDAMYDSGILTQDQTLSFGQLGCLKYAHLTKDMFMSARYGNKPTVLIPTGENGTIPALREASAIQRFIDILSITGQRYFDKVKGLFGVEPEGPKDDRVQFLARYQQYIKVGEVLTTADAYDSNGNVLSQTGDYAGRGILIDGKYLFKRRFTEHGYLFCISSVIPDVAYDGLSRELTDVNVFDSPIPSMSQVGDQTIYNREVYFDMNRDNNHTNNNRSFGDQFRYYAYKSATNEVHGFFKMETARPWSPLLPGSYSIPKSDSDRTVVTPNNPIDASRVYPMGWNYLFSDTSDEYIFGDRLFFNIDFYEKITRALPKYINYHL